MTESRLSKEFQKGLASNSPSLGKQIVRFGKHALRAAGPVGLAAELYTTIKHGEGYILDFIRGKPLNVGEEAALRKFLEEKEMKEVYKRVEGVDIEAIRRDLGLPSSKSIPVPKPKPVRKAKGGKVKKVMKEYKKGSGKPVRKRKQAIAIALSSSRKRKKK